jgi:tryptophanyl-tRNA synthetase
MFTDPLKIKKDDPGHPEGCVVFAFHKIFDEGGALQLETQCKAGGAGCVSCKKRLIEILTVFMKPLAQKRSGLMSDKSYLEKVLNEGTQKARQAAAATMEEIRKAMKL